MMVNKVFEAFDEGCPAIFLTGRSLYDLVLDSEGRIRPFLEAFRIEARRARGMHVVTYSMAGGLDWNDTRIEATGDRDAIARVLRAHGLLDIPQDQNEVVRVVRGISSLARSQQQNLRWTDGTPFRFAFLCEFGEHLAPGTLTNGTQSDQQLVAIELAHITAQSLALRTSGHLFVVHAREGLVDPLLCSALRHVRLPQPDEAEKTAFTRTALSVYTDAKLESGVDLEMAARLGTNTPNRGIEVLIRASHRTKQPVTAKAIAAQKSRDIESLSEGTLTVLDSQRVHGVRLEGRNVAVPRQVLQCVAAAIRRGDRCAPANILLAGGPGTGKTDLAILTAMEARAAAYAMHSAKSAHVGETERKARLQNAIVNDSVPCVVFCDEMPEVFPMERSDFNGDSGASNAVMAAMLTALSDETRRGRSLIVGSTNVPWRVGHAMLTRFDVLPVLAALREDMPAIVMAVVARIGNGINLDSRDATMQEAAEIFHDKGASARQVSKSVTTVAMLKGRLTADEVIAAARDLVPRSDHASSIYADLWAIRACTSQSFLPWADDPASYPFPLYLKGIVNPATGVIDGPELNRRLDELRPSVNV